MFRPDPKTPSAKPPKGYKPKYKPTGEGELLDYYKSLPPEKWICTGCGVKLQELTHVNVSHIIQKSLRPDFRLKKWNSTIHCYKCHDVWDKGSLEHQIEYLDDFDFRMRTIYLHDKRIYWQKVNKLKDHYGIDFKLEL